MMTPSRTAEKYIAIAKDVAQNSKCKKRRFGAVAVIRRSTYSHMSVTGYNRTPYDLPCEVCTRKEPGSPYDNCMAIHAEHEVVVQLLTKKNFNSVKLYVYGEDVASGREIVAVNPCFDCAVVIRKLKDMIKVVGHNEFGEVVEWDGRTLYKEVIYVERG